VAPGVTTMAITRNAPTVCSAATVQADSRVKNTIRSRLVFSPSERALVLVEEGAIRSFHFSASIVIETAQMMNNCTRSSGVIARMLPSTIFWTLTDVGLSDTMNSPARRTT
jgi:hypothetical protein